MQTCQILITIIFCALIPSVACPTACLGQDVPKEYKMREHASPNGEKIKYVVYTPSTISVGAHYPFVVYLHGWCKVCVTHERILKESGLQFWHAYGQNKQVEPTFLFAPVGGTEFWHQEPRREAIFEIIDGLIKEFPIDTKRIYILGFSMGGHGIWNYLQHRPGFFAAANPQAIGGGEVNVNLVKDTPIWATIGAQDKPDRVAQLTENISNIRAANGDERGALTNVTGVNPRFSIFPETNHGGAQAKTQEIPELRNWFYSQVNDGNISPVIQFVIPQIENPINQASSNLKVSVVARDADGEIAQIDFYCDDVLKGSVKQMPFEFTFTDLAPGVHALTATAYDNKMKKNTASCSVTVR